MNRLIAAMGLGLILAGAAVADEAWDTEIGEVIYDHDTDEGHAVLTYPIEGSDVRGIGYIEGLAGQTTGRQAYAGLWVEPDGTGSERCPYAIADPETGEPRWTWGQIEMVFVQPDFPASWVIQRGYCFEDPSEFLVGQPVTADSE
ncbi:MAG: hypothetical protein RIB03_05640 [Henriciella sp.]|uniref:hypothetical protein n=1 Tax=Henriciella sp. TaxID=1968823 RepID=UPI0032EEC2C4